MKFKVGNNGFVEPMSFTKSHFLKVRPWGENRIKYVRGEKPLRMIGVIEANKPTANEKESFTESMSVDFGYRLYDTIEINDEFIDYVVNTGECFIKWLLKEGYVKEIKEFQPFKLELPIDTIEDFRLIELLVGDTVLTDVDNNYRERYGTAISSGLNLDKFYDVIYNKKKELGL